MRASDSVVESGVRQGVLPLHLSAADHLMVAQDVPEFPSTFVVQLEFRGRIDRPSLEAALGEALDRHPLLTALLLPGKGGKLCWTATDQRLPPLDWSAEGAPISCPGGESIDLSREIGLRVWVRQGVECASVLFQFHHAAVDGTGAYRFLGDLLACYGARTDTSGTPPVLAPVEPKMLRFRAERLFDGPPSLSRIGWPAGLAEAWKIFVRRPAPLTPPTAQSGDRLTADFPGFLLLSLSREECQRLRSAAGERGAMLNDLLLRDAFLALDEWNRLQGAGRRTRGLRIMMPTDMRQSEDCEMPAANLTSYTFLNRHPGRWGAPDELLTSIRDETAVIKSNRSGTKFMHIAAWASRRSRLLPFFASRNVCWATVILSNVADPSRRFTAKFTRQSGRIVCGNLVLEAITGVPPMRAKTRATFSISQYDRRLTVSLRCDPHYFRMEDTATLLEIYVRRLKQSAAT